MVLGTSESKRSMLDTVPERTELRAKQAMHQEDPQLQVVENTASSTFLKSKIIFLYNKKSVGRQSPAVQQWHQSPREFPSFHSRFSAS